MTTLVLTDKRVVQQQATLRDIADQLHTLNDANDLNEVRARIEAARAWAKVHGMVKHLRLDLLAVEVEALVRIIELDAAELLPASERKAAEWLAGMSLKERKALVKQSGSATTAVGMCRSIWTVEELRQERALRVVRGKRMAADPTPPATDEIGVEQARARVHGVRAALAELVESYTDAGVAFTVSDLADELMSEAASEVQDEAVAQGIREVCRDAVRKAPTLSLGETVLPRIVTARNADGEYLRIPVENALMSHLDDMRALRREQLRQDSEALARLDEAAVKLREIPGCNNGSRIGALLTRAVLAAAS